MKRVLNCKNYTLYHGDVLQCIETAKNESIQCCITSPTYWGKRQFTDDTAEFGIETLEDYVNKNVLLYSKILQKMTVGGSLFIVM